MTAMRMNYFCSVIGVTKQQFRQEATVGAPVNTFHVKLISKLQEMHVLLFCVEAVPGPPVLPYPNGRTKSCKAVHQSSIPPKRNRESLPGYTTARVSISEVNAWRI